MTTQPKIDLHKLHKTEYVTPTTPTLITVGKATYLAVSGRGAPGGEDFQTKVAALYAIAYTVKMTRKFAGERDYVVGKLEGQYWSDREGTHFGEVDPGELRWRLMIRVPDFIGKRDLRDAAAKLKERNKGQHVDEVELVSIDEGTCIQMLHVGPYDQEGETIAQMVESAAGEGLHVSGRHHEIYLSDPRRVAPEKLRTILRLPVRG